MDAGRRRERPVVDAQIFGLLCLLGSISVTDLVFYERVPFYLEDYYMFYISMLYFGRAIVEIEK